MPETPPPVAYGLGEGGMKKSDARLTSVRTPGINAAGLTATHQLGLVAALLPLPNFPSDADMNGLKEPRWRSAGELATVLNVSPRLNFKESTDGSECRDKEAPKFCTE